MDLKGYTPSSSSEVDMIQHALQKIDALESRVSHLEAENKDLHKRLTSTSEAILAMPEQLIRMIETMAYMRKELKMEISLLEKDSLSDKNSSRQQFEQKFQQHQEWSHCPQHEDTRAPCHIHQGCRSQSY